MTEPITTRRLLPWIKLVLAVELGHLILSIISNYQTIILNHLQHFN